MVTKISDLQTIGEVLLDRCYKQIRSGKKNDLKKAKSTIAAIQKLYTLSVSNQILIDVNLWLNNDRTAKKEQFLESIWTRSKGQKNSSSWEVQARIARGARQAGRFRFAQKHFETALTLASKDKNADPQSVADVITEYAESRVYLGYPGTQKTGALGLLSTIGNVNMLGWQYWIRAFALHQNAFVKKSAFGSAVNVLNPPLGDRGDYTASITAIDAALPTLYYNARCDIELLRAANYGALARVDMAQKTDPAANQQAAADALAAFQADRVEDQPTKIGKNWSIHKEKRGRFYLKYRQQIDGGPYTPSRVLLWREAYREHFLTNLRIAGLQETSNKADVDYVDGNNDTDEDYPNDDAP